MNNIKEIEEEINKIALSYMERCRPERDVPHLASVVFYMKKLIEKEGGEPRILLPAIYLHDIGYAGFFEEGYNEEDVLKVKEKHMEIGAKESKTILEGLGYFTEEEIEEICRLVSLHDNLSEINDFNLQMVFEADSLGQINTDQVPSSWPKEDFRNWIENSYMKKRVPLFKTETGKELLEEILPITKKYCGME